MKLLVVSRGVRPLSRSLSGGAEHVLWSLAHRLAQQGHDVHVVSDADDDLEVPPSITLHRVGVPGWLSRRCRKSGFYLWVLLHFIGNFLAFRAATRALSSAADGATPFDVVHCHGSLSGLLLSRHVGRQPLVYTEHDSSPWSCRYPRLAERLIRRTVYGLINVRMFRRAKLNIVLYSEHKTELHERWGIPLSRIAVVPNGVDVGRFNISSGVQANGHVLSNGFSKDFGLFVGRLEPRKGVDLLLRALKDSSVHGVIIGDGPERKRLEELGEKLGLGSRVRFLGEVENSQLGSFYRKSLFFVMPSHSDAFPLTALEAMACGAPVIASRVGAARDLIGSSECGLLFTPGDHADLAVQIRQLESAPDAARSLGENGIRSVAERYSWEKVASQTGEIYSQLVARPRADIALPGELVRT